MKHDITDTVKVRIISNAVTALILTVFIAYLIVEWKNIPDTVATHFGVSGEADAYGGKNSLLVLPAIAFIISAVLAVIECFPQAWNFPVKVTEENRERLISDGVKLTGAVKILLAALISYIGFCSVKCMPVSWPIYAILGALAVVLTAGIFKMIRDK